MDYFGSDQLINPEKGDLLISEPYLPDPNFERTVVLLCEHDENGTLGFVLNRPANAVFGEVIEDVSHFDEQLYVGGPVQNDTLHFIHRAKDQMDSGKEIATGAYWGGDFDRLVSLIDTREVRKEDYRFFVGYSGWSPGQLDEELKSKSWIIFKNANNDLLFDTSPEGLWKEVLKRMGGKFKLMANYPVDPRMN